MLQICPLCVYPSCDLFSVSNLGILAIIPLLFSTSAQASEERGPHRLERIVDEVIGPLMKENGVPGMAVAVTVQGKRHFFNYGVASKETRQQVTENTIFEIGSISKTFTAILASYAQERGTLSLTDKASQHLPQLAGSSFDRISLLDLGTYTAGGLPLQFPAGVSSGYDDRLLSELAARPMIPEPTGSIPTRASACSVTSRPKAWADLSTR